jgi:DNA uptake protein ComE-like DNA-binding protein
VRLKVGFAGLPIALAIFTLAAAAQYSDRDTTGAPQTSARAPAPEERIDINHASSDELMKAPGMTRSWAARIVRYRPYRTKLDLLNHGIVTREVYERINDYLIAHREEQQ